MAGDHDRAGGPGVHRDRAAGPADPPPTWVEPGRGGRVGRVQQGLPVAAGDELGRELAPERIRVNAVSPGSILFPGGGWDSLRERNPERFERFIERDLPFGRLGTPEEIADVVAFLLSERASWISGTHICVDGAQGRPSAAAW